MTMISSSNKIDAGPFRGFRKVPGFRQASFLNSAMTSSVKYPPMIYDASDVDAVEYLKICLKW